MDHFQLLFLAGSGLLVLVQSIRGWRVGVVRQLANLSALLLAYVAAILSGRLAVPILRPLGYPDLILAVLAGAAVGCVVFAMARTVVAMIFRRTDQKRLGLSRLGYGAGGSLIGFTGALVTVWLLVVGVRLLGTVAEAEVNAEMRPEAVRAGIRPDRMALELARIRRSLDAGATGALLKETDPVPQRTYIILGKIARVLSNPESMRRFIHFPGTQALSQNPRILALQGDTQIERQVGQRDFMGLLGNPKIVAAMNDPDLEGKVKGFELEKALDYALEQN